VLAGRGRFLMGGRQVIDSMSALEGITPKFTAVRHPRTCVGLNADTSTVYLCTVDGRQASSIGMTFAEMADFMISIGATEAFNLDGGGSTTMVVRGAIVNSPSDATGERSVANALHVISTAPEGTLHFLPAPSSHRAPFR
jgi:exopolysaccharide biosynthesis protein